MSALTEFLYPAPLVRRTPLSLLHWWESRRLKYNLVVGATGVFSALTCSALLAAPPHSSIPDIRMVLMAAAVYAVLANVCYSLGWLSEMAARIVWRERAPYVGPLLFRQGLIFSVGLTLLPIIVCGMSWMARVVSVIVH
jgi:hypothetical protein